MERSIEKDLLEWKKQRHRIPLIIRGARQIGKTFIVEKFGAAHFDLLVKINFEKEPVAANCFESFDPTEILKAIEIYTKQKISMDNTLLFLDEIQACPKALMALRYFKEELPQMAVIAAGSLLEFALKDENEFRMPVGRVEYLFMYPVSWTEFARAQGHSILCDRIKETDLKNPLPTIGHTQAINLVRQYMAVGGMPEVVNTLVEGNGYLEAQKIQSRLLNTFRDDFRKYSKTPQHRYLELVFEKAPGLIAEIFKYSKIDPQLDPRPIREAMNMLVDANILHPVYATAAQGVPLFSSANIKKLKLLFLDVGLVQRACRIDLEWLLEDDFTLINRGALAEQLVGQELLTTFNKYEKAKLYFWTREKVGSSAEVDYLVNMGGNIVPIEVKAGTTGRLRSLKIFMEEKQIPLGIRISTTPLALEDKILSVPFYMIAELPRLLHDYLRKDQPRQRSLS